MARLVVNLALAMLLIGLAGSFSASAQTQAATQALTRADRDITRQCEQEIIADPAITNENVYAEKMHECKQRFYGKVRNFLTSESIAYIALFIAYVFVLGIAVPEFAFQTGLSKFWQFVGYFPILNLIPLYLAADRVSAINAITRRKSK